MGYYLGVTVVYGVAWEDAPGACYKDADGEYIEAGEPVYGGRLSWGQHGYLSADPGRHLEVCEAPSGEAQGAYALRVPWEQPDADKVVKWDAWIIDYLEGLGLTPEQIPTPGWLALGEFG